MTCSKTWTAVALVLAGTTLGGCDDAPSPNLAPSASALAPTKPATPEAKKLAIDKASSKVEFMMEAPQEKIRGRVSGATEGELQIDPSDLTKTTGLIAVDIGGIELFQAVADDKGKFAEEKKSDLQNEHARTWLEISPDTPEADRKKNARVEFAIRKIDGVSEKDATKLTGAERKVTLKASGDFLLHGRKTQKTIELEATLRYEGDKLVGVGVRSTKPFAIGLEEHDVKPREAFGKLAQKTLQALSPKVAAEAQVSIELSAGKPGSGAAAERATATPVTSAAPAAGSASAAPAAATAAPKKY